jgi:hypothetical protein
MRHPLLDGCSRGLIASILAAALCAAPPASAEIFKCFAKDRTPIYQNFPCQFNSIDSVPSSLQPAKMSLKPANASPAKPKAVPINVALAVKPPDRGEPSVGMAPDEIRTLLGEPMEIVEDQPSEGIETWRYVNRSVQIDRTQRVVVDLQSWH